MTPWLLLWLACTGSPPTIPEATAPARVVLEPPPAPPEPTATTPASTWTCAGGQTVTVAVLDDGRLDLRLAEHGVVLDVDEPQEGDAARWSLGSASFAFRGARARFARDQVPVACTADPWVALEEQARDARAVFLVAAPDRAWTLEVHPRRLALEEDGRRASLPTRGPYRDGGAWVWEEDNAHHAVGLRLAPGDCALGDATWPLTATLRLDDRVLRGCARDLRR